MARFEDDGARRGGVYVIFTCRMPYCRTGTTCLRRGFAALEPRRHHACAGRLARGPRAPASAATSGPQAGTASFGQRDWGACDRAIQLVEARSSLPHGLLAAVALTESGRLEPSRRAVIPWPWTVNSQGEGHYFDSAAQAIAWVAERQREGVRSIDVGCMQINLLHHPDAFASLEAAFDPVHNVAYGAKFLVDLRAGTGSLERAVERYHTAELERGRAYRERVFARWNGADSGRPTRHQRYGPGHHAGRCRRSHAPATGRYRRDRRDSRSWLRVASLCHPVSGAERAGAASRPCCCRAHRSAGGR